jgi:endonuclease/exonuclease/phosphatase family metal-dependent hydrolase
MEGDQMTTFKVMTWNVENLFRPNPEAEEEVKQHYRSKLELLADVIGRLDPDIVALQEIGGENGEEPLEDLQEALGGSHPHRALSAFRDGRDIQVAFLSKHAVDEREDIVNFPEGPALDIHDLDEAGEPTPIERMGRGALRARVNKDDLTVDLITAHLKSKLLTFPGGRFAPRNEGERAQVAGIALERRTAEAVTLRIRANELLGGDERTPLLVLGDLNDVPEAQTSLVLNGPPGSEICTRGFNIPDGGDAARLFNLAPAIPQEQRFSRIHRGRGELLDQILASVEFFPVGDDNRRRLPEVESHVDVAGGLPSVGENPAEREEDVAPDHAPVTATFDL